jgi:hypothetical protein
MFGDKGGELQLGSGFPIYNQSFQIIQSENLRNFSRSFDLQGVRNIYTAVPRHRPGV